MPVFGFVLTLERSRGARLPALRALLGEPGLTLGELQGARLPLVLETIADEPPQARVERWLQTPGIVHVDYVFADFADLANDANDASEQGEPS